MRPLALCLLLISLTGCGASQPYPVPVSGGVRVNGQPLAEGRIWFMTPGKPPEIVDIKEGRFSGRVRFGDHQVQIVSYRPYRIPPNAPAHLHDLLAKGKENMLPDRYGRKSTLQAVVREYGANEFEFDLELP